MYDDDCHWHLGVWEISPSPEAVAFKRKDNGTWDIFYNEFVSPDEAKMLLGENAVYLDEHFGYFILNATEDNAEAEFKKWYREKLLQYRNKEKRPVK